MPVNKKVPFFLKKVSFKKVIISTYKSTMKMFLLNKNNILKIFIKIEMYSTLNPTEKQKPIPIEYTYFLDDVWLEDISILFLKYNITIIKILISKYLIEIII